MYTITKTNDDTTIEEFYSEGVAKVRFRRLQRQGEYRYLRLSDANDKTLLEWDEGHKAPEIKDRRE